jgi:indole-3-glycerol phosphate synthase/phosphoribosylanthranilate isomerase
MPGILDDIVANKRREVEQRKAAFNTVLTEPAVERATPEKFEAALKDRNKAVKLILEVKPASPSAGVLKQALDLDGLLNAYNPYASAISVLTDEKYFQGSLALLSEVKRNTPHPVLCKDFIIDPLQVTEARQAGADAVLLIVKILTDDQLTGLTTEIRRYGMTPLIEIQNEQELERALAVNPSVLLINNRNLETFEISFDTTRRLAPSIPKGIIPVSASGIASRQDIEQLLPYTDCFLIGSSLMRQSLAALPATLTELSST